MNEMVCLCWQSAVSLVAQVAQDGSILERLSRKTRKVEAF